MTWTATILTLYPEMFPGPLGHAVAGRALAAGGWRCDVRNIRDFATDKHQSVDDTPYGGGAGMVLRADVVGRALDATLREGRPCYYLSPRGTPFTQAHAEHLAAHTPGVVLLCGRFEGIDQRVLDHYGMAELSIGDYVLAGGEVAAMTVLDACVRLLPQVMGNTESHREESFASGLLEYPHYTRPAVWQGLDVPEVLRSGDHGAIRRWRLAQAEELTRQRRPDVWARYREKTKD
jgi:tRNA (guanine37-N1)-methyltransferase